MAMVLPAWRIAFAVFVAVAPGLAAAADLPAQSAPSPTTAPSTYAPAPPGWIVTVGLEGRLVPAWAGAPDSEFGWSAMPLFSVRREGTPAEFFGPRDSFGFPILDLGQFKFGPAVKFVWQREASSYAALNGLGNVNFAVQAGGFAEFWPMPWLRLRGEVRQGIGGETGVTGDVFLDGVVPIGQWRLSGGPRLTLQSAAAINPYFGITQRKPPPQIPRNRVCRR